MIYRPPPGSSSAEDAQKWSENIEPILYRMLASSSNYSPSITSTYLEFFSRSVAPALGVFPTKSSTSSWRSLMTDAYLPLEFSFSYTCREKTVRFAVEPVGHEAGTRADPFNLKDVHQNLNKILEQESSVDTTLFEVLRCHLLADSHLLGRLKTQGRGDALSQLFVGFDLGKGQKTAKFYFLPGVRAACSSRTCLQLISDALPDLESCSAALQPSFSLIIEYLKMTSVMAPTLEIVSVDGCRPLYSRLKLYIRHRNTSFAKVWDFFTLGGTLETVACDKVYQCLQKLWYCVMGLPNDFPTSRELDTNPHYTAGTIHYFSLRPGSPVPEPKVYIPVRHYARSDEEVAQGLERAFQSFGWDQHANDYVNSLKSIFPHCRLEKGTGLQTYVSFSMKRGEITVESYFSPAGELDGLFT